MAGKTYESEDTKYYDSDEHIPKSMFDFKFIVTKQIDMARYWLTIAKTREEIDIAEDSVAIFETLMIDNLQTDYYEGKKRIKKMHKKLITELYAKNPKELKASVNQLKKRYIMNWWALLMKKAGKAGITNIKKVSVDMW